MRDPHPGIMRRALIGLLGMPVGELWNLDPLATACAADGWWSFLLIVAPLEHHRQTLAPCAMPQLAHLL